MTLNDILVSALVQLSRGADAQSLDIWRDKLTIFANEGVLDIADALGLSVTEEVTLQSVSGGEGSYKFAPSELTREPLRILHSQLTGNGKAKITYVPAPKELCSPADVPELPKSAHSLIVSYVVARERASGDVGHQRGSDVYFNLYERGKRKLKVLAPGADRLINRY